MPEILKGANVRLSWTPSVSTDVTEQRLKVEKQGPVTVLDVVLPPAATQHDFAVDEQDQLTITLIAFDGTNESVPVVLNETIPDLSIPLAPVGLVLDILSTFDLPV